MAYKFTLQLDYDLESDNGDDALNEVVELIKRDWIEYVDEGELTEIKEV